MIYYIYVCKQDILNKDMVLSFKYKKIFSDNKMVKDFSLKYKIQEKLESLSYKDYGIAIQELPKVLQISRRTFQRYLKTRVYESYSIRSDDLVKLSKFFNCKIEDLLNYDPPPLKLKGIRKHKNIDIKKRFQLVK